MALIFGTCMISEFTTRTHRSVVVPPSLVLFHELGVCRPKLCDFLAPLGIAYTWRAASADDLPIRAMIPLLRTRVYTNI